MNLPLPPRLSAGSALCFVRRALRPRGRAARLRAEAPGAAGGAWPAASFGETGGLSSGRRPSGKRKVSAAPRLRLPPRTAAFTGRPALGSGLESEGSGADFREAGAPLGMLDPRAGRGLPALGGTRVPPPRDSPSPSRFPARGARGCCPCSDSRG